MKDIKKTLKKIKPIRKETKKVFAESAVLVLLEDMHDSIKIIAEGLIGTNEKLDSFKEESNEKFEEINWELSSLKGEVSSLKGELDSFKEETNANFKQVFSYFSHIEEELVDIRKELKKLENKVDLEKFQKLEKRVAFLEKQQLIFMQKEKIKEKIKV